MAIHRDMIDKKKEEKPLVLIRIDSVIDAYSILPVEGKKCIGVDLTKTVVDILIGIKHKEWRHGKFQTRFRSYT